MGLTGHTATITAGSTDRANFCRQSLAIFFTQMLPGDNLVNDFPGERLAGSTLAVKVESKINACVTTSSLEAFTGSQVRQNSTDPAIATSQESLEFSRTKRFDIQLDIR